MHKKITTFLIMNHNEILTDLHNRKKAWQRNEWNRRWSSILQLHIISYICMFDLFSNGYALLIPNMFSYHIKPKIFNLSNLFVEFIEAIPRIFYVNIEIPNLHRKRNVPISKRFCQRLFPFDQSLFRFCSNQLIWINWFGVFNVWYEN